MSCYCGTECRGKTLVCHYIAVAVRELPESHSERLLAETLAETVKLLRDMNKHAICMNREREPCGECWTCRQDAILAKVGPWPKPGPEAS